MPGADVRNAAVLLRSLPSEAAAALLASLSPREVELLQAEMAGNVSTDEETGAFTAFAAASGVAHHPSTIEARPFDFLERVDRRCLVALLSEEHPQTCAVVLSQLPTESAVELLLNLPADVRPDVIERIATMGQVRCDVLHDVAQCSPIGWCACASSATSLSMAPSRPPTSSSRLIKPDSAPCTSRSRTSAASIAL